MDRVICTRSTAPSWGGSRFGLRVWTARPRPVAPGELGLMMSHSSMRAEMKSPAALDTTATAWPATSRPAPSSITRPLTVAPSPRVRTLPARAAVALRSVLPDGSNPVGSPDSSKLMTPSPTRVARSGTVSAWLTSYTPARTRMRAPALAGESADCSSAAVVTTMSGSWGDAATVDGEIANAITIAMIANVIAVNVILFIAFSSFNW